MGEKKEPINGAKGHTVNYGNTYTLGIDKNFLLQKAQETQTNQGLSRAGHALDKHGNREVTSFPKTVGNISQKNADALKILDDILSHPRLRSTSRPYHRTNGRVIDLQTENGKGYGARFHDDGRLEGFLEGDKNT